MDITKIDDTTSFRDLPLELQNKIEEAYVENAAANAHDYIVGCDWSDLKDIHEELIGEDD